MLFAVPLALFSAMYVSHFTTPGFKRTIKPIVEVMAAVPTVVVGFLILLWAGPAGGQLDRRRVRQLADDPADVRRCSCCSGSCCGDTTGPSGSRTATSSSCWSR